MKWNLKASVLTLILCTVLLQPFGSIASESLAPYLAIFPGMPSGNAIASNDGVLLQFPLQGGNPLLADGGRTLRLPVRQGILNEGTLCILLEEGASASVGNSLLQVRWTGERPLSGRRVRIGEAVLALPRAPRYYERLTQRRQTGAFGIGDVVGIVNDTHDTVMTMRPAGWIVRVPVWLECRTYRMYAVVLGTPPAPVDGNRVDSTVGENLRYVSSTVLLPQGYQAALSWTRNLPGIKQGEVFAFHRDALPPLRTMLKAAVDAGVADYDLENSYRSADWQKALFDRRLSWSKADKSIADPLAATLRRVARPNGSEHQTGMAFDMASRRGAGDAFAGTKEYEWLAREGWKYGYVVRYPAGSEAVTGIMFEPWHIRWFDVPVAAWLQRRGAVYEELVAEVKAYGAVWLGEATASGGAGTAAARTATAQTAPTTTSSAVLGADARGPSASTTTSSALSGADARGSSATTTTSSALSGTGATGSAAPSATSSARSGTGATGSVAPSTTLSAILGIGTAGATASTVTASAVSGTGSAGASAPATTSSAVAGGRTTARSSAGRDADGDGIVWLAVAATPDAVYASAISSLAPEISEFLSDRRIWLIPMGKGGMLAP